MSEHQQRQQLIRVTAPLLPSLDSILCVSLIPSSLLFSVPQWAGSFLLFKTGIKYCILGRGIWLSEWLRRGQII